MVQLRTAAIGHQKSWTLLLENVELISICRHPQNFPDILGEGILQLGYLRQLGGTYGGTINDWKIRNPVFMMTPGHPSIDASLYKSKGVRWNPVDAFSIKNTA